jgi:hypothetical protein
MQFLVQELAKEDVIFLASGAECPVWSPLNAFDAASALLGVLNAARPTPDAKG